MSKRIPVSYRIEHDTKRRIEFLAALSEKGQGEMLDEIVDVYLKHNQDKLKPEIDRIEGIMKPSASSKRKGS